MTNKSISTKKGDCGETGLLNGKRIQKYDLRTETCGTMDEASSFIGMARAKCNDEAISSALLLVQKHLYLMNAELACPDPCKELKEKLSDTELREIEDIQQLVESKLELPKKFVIYGERELSSIIDTARAVIRRAERRLAELSAAEQIRPILLRYINRASDFLFLLARYDEHSHDAPYRHFK
ncbi:MAG: cob(I)yrinic acid a,c-diamide adenosyltransferase [Spirochaetales bacterium]|nr:cob(I)yrinic acid a,c-diamide adenosyltransferase [Spirochaetales bacterium]